MTRHALSSGLCLAATLAAAVASTHCGGGQDAAPPPPISMAAVDNLVPGQLARGAALITEIRSAGEPCDSVTRTFLQGTKDGDQVWNAECADGHSYGVLSKADGTMEVQACSALARTTGTECFEKF